jgi:hypothetical protein
MVTSKTSLPMASLPARLLNNNCSLHRSQYRRTEFSECFPNCHGVVNRANLLSVRLFLRPLHRKPYGKR